MPSDGLNGAGQVAENLEGGLAENATAWPALPDLQPRRPDNRRGGWTEILTWPKLSRISCRRA